MTKQTIAERIHEFNAQFDYGEYHDSYHFWLEMLGHQIDEAREAYHSGDVDHVHREAADAVLVAFQMMESLGERSPELYVMERIANAESVGISEEIVPKYTDWYERRVVLEDGVCPRCRTNNIARHTYEETDGSMWMTLKCNECRDRFDSPIETGGDRP